MKLDIVLKKQSCPQDTISHILKCKERKKGNPEHKGNLRNGRNNGYGMREKICKINMQRKHEYSFLY